MNFKIKDNIKCVNNDRSVNQLTLGKIYEVKGVYSRDRKDFVSVTDDTGYTCSYYKWRFENILFNCQRRRLLK